MRPGEQVAGSEEVRQPLQHAGHARQAVRALVGLQVLQPYAAKVGWYTVVNSFIHSASHGTRRRSTARPRLHAQRAPQPRVQSWRRSAEALKRGPLLKRQFLPPPPRGAATRTAAGARARLRGRQAILVAHRRRDELQRRHHHRACAPRRVSNQPRRLRRAARAARHAGIALRNRQRAPVKSTSPRRHVSPLWFRTWLRAAVCTRHYRAGHAT